MKKLAKNRKNLEGLVYLIPNLDGDFIVAQIGLGGDIGILFPAMDEWKCDEFDSLDVIFRVQFGKKSPKQHGWLEVGFFDLKSDLSVPGRYYYRSIGSDECWEVVSTGIESKIDCCSCSGLEELATWSHEHIVQRFQTHQKGCYDSPTNI